MHLRPHSTFGFRLWDTLHSTVDVPSQYIVLSSNMVHSNESVQESVRKMKMLVVVSLSLLWSLVEVNSQTFPYVSFMGQTLANHSYVDLSQVGDDGSGSNSVQCHTNLDTCCSGGQGPHRGDWYFPNGDRLQFSGDILERRDYQRVELHRSNSATSPVGIYHCEIPTIDVHDDSDISVRDAPVFVGLYTGSGGKFLFQQTLDYLFQILCRRYLSIWRSNTNSEL